jgi:RimJ/RimL family protein N-acetyltransferase
MHELEQAQFEKTRSLFMPLTHHLSIESILAGSSPGRVFVDDVKKPRTAVAWFKRRLFLAGNRTNETINVALNRLFTNVYYPEMIAAGLGQSAFTMVYTPGWDRVMDVVLAGKNPLRGQRHCYRLDPSKTDWKVRLPREFKLRWVDAALLADSTLTNLDYVTNEMVSERASVEDFLEKSFGTCVVKDNEIVGWCMTEYNTENRCELGIATADEFQRQGLATTGASATMREAARRGYTEIGWVCDVDNKPSMILAQKLGFSLLRADDTYFAFFDPMLNQGVNGNMQLQQQNYQEAVIWYERAAAYPNPPIWLLWNTAVAWANLNNSGKTFSYLNQLVDSGFDDYQFLQVSEHFRAYHRTKEWRALLARFDA